jgi:hypothetical protein
MSSLIAELRGPKIAGVVVADTVATGIAAMVVNNGINGSRIKNGLPEQDFTLGVFLVLILISVVLHGVMGVPTMTNYYLGLNTVDEVFAARGVPV